MAEDAKFAERKTQPRFSQFALTAARDTSAFEPPAADEASAAPARKPEPGRARDIPINQDGEATDGSAAPSPNRPRSTKAPSPLPATDAEELVSFTVRLPASLYMRMRRSLGLRERLGDLCVAAITRELDLRR